MTDRQAVFAFPDEMAALIFVRQLVETMSHLAVLRTGRQVIVLDGGQNSRKAWIAGIAALRAGAGLGGPPGLPEGPGSAPELEELEVQEFKS